MDPHRAGERKRNTGMVERPVKRETDRQTDAKRGKQIEVNIFLNIFSAGSSDIKKQYKSTGISLKQVLSKNM